MVDEAEHQNRAESTNLKVLCVDDNVHVAEALRIMIERVDGFAWSGWLGAADELVATVQRECPDVVILDVDMPGRSPFDALEELCQLCPATRTVMFSGHVRSALVEQALSAGAWGYVSKNDGETALLQAIREVAGGDIALSPEAGAVYHRRGTAS